MEVEHKTFRILTYDHNNSSYTSQIYCKRLGNHGKVEVRGVRGSVDEILERRKRTKQPFWNELEVAVAHGVHCVESDEVNVHSGHRHSAKRPRSDDWDSEICSVHDMLRKWMHSPCIKHTNLISSSSAPTFHKSRTGIHQIFHMSILRCQFCCTCVGFGDEQGVVVGMVASVEVMVMKRPVKPVVNGLRRAHVQQQDDHETAEVPLRIQMAAEEGKSTVGRTERQCVQYYVVIPAQTQSQSKIAACIHRP